MIYLTKIINCIPNFETILFCWRAGCNIMNPYKRNFFFLFFFYLIINLFAMHLIIIIDSFYLNWINRFSLNKFFVKVI